MTPDASSPFRSWKHGKPVVGITGGIGSGKSTISRMFAEQGCAVIDSDALSHEILQTPAMKEDLRQWLGAGIFLPNGDVSRRAVAQAVFADPAMLERLNRLVHPKVNEMRNNLMNLYLAEPTTRAIVWDSPLLIETGLDRECDVVVFVQASEQVRRERVAASRNWTPEELARRENLQFPLDKKANVADYCIDNSGEQASSLRQVQQVLSHLLATSR